jgi:hypothetical protein
LKKTNLCVIIAIIIIAATVPLTIAAYQQTQRVHVNGSAYYPVTNPTPTPTSTSTPPPTSTYAFSLWFPNGTTLPSTSSLTVPTIMTTTPNSIIIVDDPAKLPPSICYVRNDGNQPINVTANFLNIVIPSQNLNCLFYIRYFAGIDDGTALASRQFPPPSTSTGITVQPNNSVSIEVDLVFYPTDTSYTSGASFDYSFDLDIIVTQAA